MRKNPNLSYVPPQLRKNSKKNKFSLPSNEGRATQKAIAARRRRRSEKRERRRSTRNRSRSRGWSRHERRQDFNDFQRYKRRRSRGRSAVNRDIPPWARTPNRNTCGNTCCIVISSILSLVFMFVAAIYIIDWIQGGDGTNAFAVIGLGRKIAGPKLPPKPPGVPGTPSTPPGQNLSDVDGFVDRYKWWIFGSLGLAACWWFDSIPFYHWNPITSLFGDPKDKKCTTRKCKWDEYEKCRVKLAPDAARPRERPGNWSDQANGKLRKDYNRWFDKMQETGGTTKAQECINSVYDGVFADDFDKPK